MRLEVFRAGDEIGFAIHFDQNAEFAIGAQESADEALLGGARFLLAGAGDAFFAEDDFGFGHIAVRFDESPLAIHHARAGAFAELFNELCADISHFVFISSIHTRGDQAGLGWSPVNTLPRRS